MAKGTSTFAVIKTLIVPAVISLILFIVSSYILVPLWRQYSRYSQYLPLNSISNHTSSFRSRIQGAISRMILPRPWRMRERVDTAGGSEVDFSSDEGEELDMVDEDRRRALSLDTRTLHTDSMRRLSRDLEEGFIDDSDDELDHRDRS